jgi:hypothetical protein
VPPAPARGPPSTSIKGQGPQLPLCVVDLEGAGRGERGTEGEGGQGEGGRELAAYVPMPIYVIPSFVVQVHALPY